MAAASLPLLALLLAAAAGHSPLPHTDMVETEQLAEDVVEKVQVAEDLVGKVQVAEPQGHRLPNDTAPSHYALRISPDFSSGDFGYSGQVTITIAARRPGVSRITLLATDISVLIATVSATTGGANLLQSYQYDTELNVLYLNLHTQLAYDPEVEVQYIVFMVFQASMRTDMYGFYRSWYTHNNETRYMGSTQFQATSARAAFPCYDEPSFKATFDILIERPANYRSWSNMRLQSSTQLASGRVLDAFHTTPRMSTYLLAFIVAEYESLEVFNENNELIYEVIARPNAIDDGQGLYALQVGQQLLAAMENHTGINYLDLAPNFKMTQAAIPDFSAGAMENWGLLTYREAYLMHDDNHTSSRFRQIIAYILSHEIAHMWFGNLVTCDWWDVLWLNEGFARYYQYFLTNWIETEMGFETRFIVEQVHTALFADSVTSSHPLTDPSLDSPSSVSAHFSTVTYNKGAAVIRMTEHMLGFEVHRLGLQAYLLERAYNTAIPTHLFAALDAAAASTGALSQYPAFTVDEYYRTWTEQAGYPLLDVHVDHTTGLITVAQRRFDRNNGYSDINAQWIVPLTFATASNPDFSDTKPTHILRDTVAVIDRGSVGDEWVIFNKQQTGYYRVNYDNYTWGLITLALRGAQRTQIHEYNRAQIVDDVLQLARAGLMSYTRAFNIISFLEFETDYAPWVAAVNGISYLERRFAGTEQLASLQTTITGWASALMNNLTYYPTDGETFMRSYLRHQLAPMMCRMGVAACRTAAAAQFAALRSTASVEVPVDSRHWVYCNALRDGTPDDFDFLWQRYQSHNVYSEKILLLENLGCTPHSESLSTLLDGIMQENFIVRRQDYGSAMSSAIGGNEANTQAVLNWIQENWETYSTAFPAVTGYLNTIAGRLQNETEIEAYESWINQNSSLFTEAQMENLLANTANARSLIDWTNSITPAVVDFLENGFQTIDLTTEAPVEVTSPSTVLPPDVDVPVVPEYSAASTITTSVATLIAAIVARSIM